MSNSNLETVIILDYGSQYTQLIARRIRELNIYCEIYNYNISKEKLRKKNVQGIILSGGPNSVYDKNAPELNHHIFDLDVPILGICYGLQLLIKNMGGKISKGSLGEYGNVHINIFNEEYNDNRKNIFLNIPKEISVWMSHTDKITKVGTDWNVIAESKNEIIAGIKHKTKDIYAVQFHPEVTHTNFGLEIISNFLFKICSLKKNWTADNFINDTVKYLRKLIGDKEVICGLSGGVDSSVLATLLHKAIGNKSKAIFINHGLLRKNETNEVLNKLQKDLGINIELLDQSKVFLKLLENVTDPEKKRKIIGKQFIKSFESSIKNYDNVKFLAQGTLYPDVIESGGDESSSAVTIKSHHNVGGLPKNMKLKLVEPLRNLFKDEVREVGKKLGLSNIIINRHPFPGPGLAVRIIGKINNNRIKILQEADDIFIKILKDKNEYHNIWQAFCVLIPIKTVGVMGDVRTYDNLIALRAVTSIDGMTANWYKLNPDILELCSQQIVNKVAGVNRVVYDITSKPPGTIEWE